MAGIAFTTGPQRFSEFQTLKFSSDVVLVLALDSTRITYATTTFQHENTVRKSLRHFTPKLHQGNGKDFVKLLG